VARIVDARYDLGCSIDCHLLNRGFNDSYGPRPVDGDRYVVRLSFRSHDKTD